MIFDEIIKNKAFQMENVLDEIKQFVRLIRQRKDRIEFNVQYMRNCLREVSNHSMNVNIIIDNLRCGPTGERDGVIRDLPPPIIGKF